MTRGPGLLSDLEVLAEYREWCRKLKYPVGTSLQVLLDHQWRQGAQLLALVPDDVERELVTRAVQRGA